MVWSAKRIPIQYQDFQGEVGTFLQLTRSLGHEGLKYLVSAKGQTRSHVQYMCSQATYVRLRSLLNLTQPGNEANVLTLYQPMTYIRHGCARFLHKPIRICFNTRH